MLIRSKHAVKQLSTLYFLLTTYEGVVISVDDIIESLSTMKILNSTILIIVRTI